MPSHRFSAAESPRVAGCTLVRSSEPRGASGFIISTELMLILTILVIGSLVGVIAVRNALFELRENKLAYTVIVKDATAPDPFMFKPVNYDLCEAPQILCRDTGLTPADPMTPGPTEGLFALVGIRPDRFVSRNRIYFTGAGCTGDAHIAPPGDPSLPIGYLNCGLQVDSAGDPVCYGVGPPSTFPACTLGVDCPDGGRLFRSDGTTTSMVSVASRWISLNPDCADLGSTGTTGELVTNGSFELPAIAVNGDFSPPFSPLPASWTVTAGAGHFNPCIVGDGLPCTFPPPHFSIVPPDGTLIAYSNGGTLSQAVALTAGATCELSAWVGCRIDGGVCAGGGARTYTVGVTDASATPLFVPLSGVLGPGSPEWQQVSTSFIVTGTAPFTLSLTSSGVQTNFDQVSLSCSVPSTAICEDIALTLDLLPTVEVADDMGANVLSTFVPNFNVMPWVPSVTYTLPVPEGAPVQDETAPGATTDPGDPTTFPAAGDEDDPPPP